MEKRTKDYLLELAEEFYENSKETIGEVLEMDIEEMDYSTLEYESGLIAQLAKMVEILDEAEEKNELDSVDDKLDFRFIKDEFGNREELRKFLLGALYEPYIDLDEFEEAINNIVKLIFLSWRDIVLMSDDKLEYFKEYWDARNSSSPMPEVECDNTEDSEKTNYDDLPF